MSLALYRLMLRMGLPFAALQRWWHLRRSPGPKADWKELFGRYSTRSLSEVVWLHASSAASVLPACALAQALRAERSGVEILITASTIAGRDTVRRICGEETLTAYLPYDLPGAVRRFLAHFRPRLGILVGLELSPTLLEACQRREIPVVLANARLPRRLARAYARFAAISRPAFASLAASCAKDRASLRRLRLLGARPASVSGDIAFDVASDPSQVEEGRALMAALRGRKALLLAGTRDGEESQLLDALANDDGTLVIIAPRDPDRFDAVAGLAAERGMSVARRSRGEAPHVGRRVFLGDTGSEMPFYYAVSTVAVIGCSFSPPGGSGVVEACAAGVPAIIGPWMETFDEATQAALAAGAAIRVDNAVEAVNVARNLLELREWSERMALAGMRLCAGHQGAMARHLEVCRRLLG